MPRRRTTCQPCLYIVLGAQPTAAATATPAASTSRVSDDGLGGGDVHEYSTFGFAGTVITTNSGGDASAEDGASVYLSDEEGLLYAECQADDAADQLTRAMAAAGGVSQADVWRAFLAPADRLSRRLR